MSDDRLSRARESGLDILSSVVADAVSALDRAIPAETFRVLGRLDGAAHYELVVELLASRLVDSLDERELIAALWWGPDLVFLRWQPPGPAKDRRCPGDNVRLADAIRASFEAGVRHALREHVAYRLDVVLGEARTS